MKTLLTISLLLVLNSPARAAVDCKNYDAKYRAYAGRCHELGHINEEDRRFDRCLETLCEEEETNKILNKTNCDGLNHCLTTCEDVYHEGQCDASCYQKFDNELSCPGN